MKSLHPESLRCTATTFKSLPTKSWNISTNRYIFATEINLKQLKTTNMIGTRLLSTEKGLSKRQQLSARITLISLMFLIAMVFSANTSGWAQIALRGSATSNISTSASVTITKPTGVVAGDIMFANIGNYFNGTQATAACSGWTVIAGTDVSRGRATLLYKVATASEPANYTFTVTTSSTACTGAIIAFSGVSSTSPFDVVAPSVWQTSASQTLTTVPAVSTLTNNTAVLLFGNCSYVTTQSTNNFTNADWNVSSIGIPTELFDIGHNNVTNSPCVGAAWIADPTAGSTGAGGMRCNVNTTSRNLAGLMLALRAQPAAAVAASVNPVCANASFNLSSTVYGNAGAPTAQAFQGFESSGSTMTYSSSGGATTTATSASTDGPASSPYFVSGTTGFRVNNGTATLTFSNVTGLSNYISKSVSLNLASFSIGNTSNGADATDNVTVAISLDGGTTYSNELTITGASASNAYWGYASGTGVATVTYDGNNTATSFAPGGSGNRTTDGYGTLVINLPDNATQARVRVTMLNNASAEAWAIDDVKISGLIITQYSWTSTPAGFTSTAANPTGVTASANTTYNLSVTNAAGFSASASTSVTVNNAPTVATPATPSAICSGASYNPTAPTVTANGSTVTAQGWQLETAVGSGSYAALTTPYTVALADNGKRVRYSATNACGTTNSATVTLTIHHVPTVSAPSAPSGLCIGANYNPSAPLVTANGSTVTAQGWEIETAVGSNSFIAFTTPYTASLADNGKDIRYSATNGCGTGVSAIVTLTVNTYNTIALSSAVGTDSLETCQNAAMQPITYTTTGATGATITGLPTGVTGSWAANTLTISGTPTVTGTYNYTVTMMGGCAGPNNTATGSIQVIALDAIYSQNFSGIANTNSNYTISPLFTTPAGVLSNGLSSSSWTATSAGVATTFSRVANVNGTGNNVIAFVPGQNQVSALTLTFMVNPGYTASINAFDFWRMRQAATAPGISSITINGTTVFGGESTPTTGAMLGATCVSNPVNNLSGTVTVVINLTASGLSTGNRYFYLDDFILYGSVSSANPYAEVYLQNFNDNPNANPYNTTPTATTGTPAGVFNSNFVANSSSWTSSTGALTFTSDANGGADLALLTPLNATSSLTLTFGVQCGYVLNLYALDFFQQRQTNICSNISSITINGTQVYGGSTATTTGAYIGVTGISPALTNLAGTVTVVINLTASNETSGNRYFYLDDFTLYGSLLATSTTPAQPGAITGTAVQCAGSTGQTYSINPVTYATTYNWTVPAGWSITSGAGTTSITVTAGSGGQNGNISVTAQNVCATSAAQTLAASVLATPAQPVAISGATVQCPDAANQTYSITAVSYATTYNWSVPAGWSITAGSGTNSITVTTGSAGQNGNISVTAQNACGTSALRTLAVTVNSAAPAQPGTISGAAAVCPAVTGQVYSISTVTNATTYNWSVPAGWSITAGSGTNSITVTAGSAGQNGNISVTAQNACGTSTAQTLAVTVNPGTPSQPGAVSGTAAVCPSISGLTYSIAAVPNATSYSWAVPTGWSITSGSSTNAITVTSGTYGQNGNVSVRAVNGCGNSAATSFAVTVNPGTPAQPGAVSGTAAVCPAVTGQTYSIALINGATTYNWTVPTGWVITSGANTNSITVTTGAYGQNGNVSVTAQNACGTSAARHFGVTVNPGAPAQPIAISGAAVLCAGVTGQNYSVLADPIASTYNWSIPNGWSIAAGSGTNAIILNPGNTAQAGVISVTAQNTCGTSASATRNVVVNPRPTAVIAGSASICAGDAAPVQLVFTGNGPWSGTLSTGNSFTSANNSTAMNISPASTATVTISTLNDANCAAVGGMNGSANVVVMPLPTAAITGSATICGGGSGEVQISGTPNAEVEYEVNGSEDAVQLDGSGLATIQTGMVWQSLVYALESIDDGNCLSTLSGSATITYQEAPDATISGSTSLCAGASTTIVFQGNPNAVVTYNYNGNANQTATLNSSGVASVNTGAITSQTYVNLEAVSIGSCESEIGTNILIQVGSNTYYQDSDGDGFGNPAASQQSCTAPAGYVSNASDCCDSNADINPMTEWWGDFDGDGQGSFIYETGCMAGVNCSTNSWSSQLIPYYPLAHGGVAYVTDCNDANALVSASASELCTTSYDDDCDGMINEGCSTMTNDNFSTATNIVLGTNTYYPNCVELSGTLLNTDVSSQGNPNNVAPGGGRDVWYKFISPSTAVRIKLNASAFNGVLELHSSTGAELNVENAVAGPGTEILNFGGLTPGQQYCIGVRNYDATNGSSFQLCVSPLMPSGCALATPLNGFNLCNSYKAIYRGATSYTFNFTGAGGTLTAPFATTSATTTGIVALSMAQLGLRYGGVYNVRVDANYQLVNGAGVVDPTIVVVGSSASANCSNVLMQQQPFVEVTSTQVCPASLNRTSYLTATASVAGQDVCSATSFTFELTRVSDCGGTSVVGLPMYVNSPSAAPIINLAAAFPTAQSSVGFWRVRVRPNFGTANGSFGPSKIIQVNNSAASGMIQEDGFVAAERKETTALSSAIYPNPNEGSAFTLQLDQPIENGLHLRVIDATGKLIMEKQFSGALGQLIDVQFDQTLSNGVYHIEVISEQNKDVHRLVVTH